MNLDMDATVRADTGGHPPLLIKERAGVRWSWRGALSLACLALALAAIFYICWFKIMDRDFWWHIKAGEIITNTHALIHTDPFAYTRGGLPYLTGHLWLAQVVLYQVFHWGGVNGVIFFRFLMIAATFALLLLIDKKSMWPNFLIVLWAAYFNRPSFMDRPQLFTFLFFATSLALAVYYWRHLFGIMPAQAGIQILNKNRRWFWLAGFWIMQYLWVNTHGAAAILGVGVAGAILLEIGWKWFANSHSRAGGNLYWQEVKFLSLLVAGLLLVSIIPPGSWHTFAYYETLTSDQTTFFINEWQPRSPGAYLVDLAPLWIVSLASLWFARRRPIFSLAILGGTGYLSFLAYRHGIIFAIAATAIIFYQLYNFTPYQQFLDKLAKYRLATLAVTLAVFGGLAFFAWNRDLAEIRRDNLFGWGVSAPAQAAYDFIEREKIPGRMFNTYSIGGYLIYHGYPSRPVFADGRNVDYGFDFLKQLVLARTEPRAWEELADKYKFNYAIIEYNEVPSKDKLGIVSHLAQNPEWKLVFVDDWTAVYVKNTVENQPLITKYGLKYLTPERLRFGTLWEQVPAGDAPVAAQELEQAVTQSPNSIIARLMLGKYYLDSKQPDKALKVDLEAAAAQPYRPETYEQIGLAYVAREDWPEAGTALEKAVALTGDDPGSPKINYDFLAMVFSKAGDSAKAKYYHNKTQP